MATALDMTWSNQFALECDISDGSGGKEDVEAEL
jgi:hypothetical protein